MARLILASSVLAFLAACATPPREYTDPRPIPTAEQRAVFGTIGVAAAGVADPQKPNAPDSFSTAEKAGVTAGGGALGAGVGALWGLGCGPYAFVCVPTFAAALGAGGLAAGMAATFPYRTEDQVNSADITLRNALLSIDIENRLVETVITRGSKITGQNLRRVGYSIESNSWDLGAPDVEVDTRMLIAASRVSLVALNPNQEANPDVRLEIVVDGKIYEGDRGAPTIERRWLYDSEAHGYFDWANLRGVLVIAEINRAIAVLGAQIASDFLGGQIEARELLISDEQVEADLATLKELEKVRQQSPVESAAPMTPAGPQVEAKARATSSTRKLRVAVFPFAGGVNSGHIAEGEIKDYAHRFVNQRRDMELVYSAYDEDFDRSAVGAGHSLWSGDFVSKSPNEMNVYRAADALDADIVLMSFYQKRTSGWFTEDLYEFDLYLLDVRHRRLYRESGHERSVREALETLFWQLETGRTAS